ncbi:MAG: O-antigen ligase family protein [Burkholderiales bacterium]
MADRLARAVGAALPGCGAAASQGVMVLKGLLFFLLMYVVNELHFHWQTGIPAVAPVNLIFLLVLLAMLFSEPDEVEVERPILKKPMFYFFGALTFAFLWAQVRERDDIISDLTYLKNALFYPLFYLLYLRCKQDAKTTRQLVIWIMVIAAVAGLEAFREGLDYGFGKYDAMKRASGPFSEDWRGANLAGVFFAMFMPMFVAFALFLKKQPFWRIAAIGGIGLIAGGTVFTYSRQSYFIVLLSSAVLLVRRSKVLAIVLSVVLISLSGYLPDSVFQRVEETKQQGKRGQEEIDESTASRWEIWGGAMEMFAHNPVGVGLDRFKRNIGSYSSHKGMDAHSFYVLTLAECGPQGLLTVLMLIWACFRLARFLRMNAAADDEEAQTLAIGFTVTTVCMALGSVYGSRFLNGPVMSCYWALCGLLERQVYLKRTAGDGQPTPPKRVTLEERFPLAKHIPRPR